MADLFSPITLRGVTLPNRIVKSAMAEGRCDAEGRPSPELFALYGRWSAGGVGLSITGMAHVLPGHSYTGGELGLYDDSLVAPLRALPEAVHRHEGKVFAQLCHAPPQLPRSRALALGGSKAPSRGFNATNLLFDRALTEEELRRIAQAFGAAARRAREAGFDGVQLHAAHGYLLSRMLSPRHNRRPPPYGGDLEGRLAFLLECYRQVRREVGDDFPVAMKLNAHDGQQGLTLDDSLRAARRLEEEGLDALEVSAGTGDVAVGFYPNKGKVPYDVGRRFLAREFPFLRPVLPLLGPLVSHLSRSAAFPGEAYFLPEAERFAQALRLPVICVGGIRRKATAERILARTKVAMVSLARPLVREPTLARRWRLGQAEEATCESCNECFVRVGLCEPLQCHLRKPAPS